MTTNELTAAVEVLRSSGRLATNDLLPILTLVEPSKESLRSWQPGTRIPRAAFANVVRRRSNQTFEAVVDLSGKSVASWKQIPGVQSLWTTVEDEEAIRLVRENPDWQSAMRRRGLTNFDEIAVSTWLPGHQPIKGPHGDRYYKTMFYLKGGQTNFYGPPIEGVEVVVNLTRSTVTQVIDTGVVPVAKESTDFYDAGARGTNRAALKPLMVSQPQGVSFTLEGNEVRWDRWHFRYSFTPREGLVLHQVRYDDAGKLRSILHRATISELLVPYGDASHTWFWRNAVDEGEYGLGKSSAPLEPGRNTPSHATLLDVPMTSDTGGVDLWPRRIDLYEREGDTLWTHYDAYAQVTEARRSRELLIGFIATIGNYDYAYHWIFRQDGSIEFLAELTGIILTKGVSATQCEVCRQKPGKGGLIEPIGEDRVGTLVAPHTVGVNHQHFMNVRLDFDLDGVGNSVKEVNARAVGRGRDNPHGNAFMATQTVFARERGAARDLNLSTHRSWAVFNPNLTTALGHHPTYFLEPAGNTVPYMDPNSVSRRFAGFVDHHFFATRFRESEMYAAGPYPAHAPKPDNLATWSRDNESIENQDVVAWHTLGLTHVTRPEDYPVMPAAKAGFKLVPKGFFNRNPSLDVPAP